MTRIAKKATKLEEEIADLKKDKMEVHEMLKEKNQVNIMKRGSIILDPNLISQALKEENRNKQNLVHLKNIKEIMRDQKEIRKDNETMKLALAEEYDREQQDQKKLQIMSQLLRERLYKKEIWVTRIEKQSHAFHF